MINVLTLDETLKDQENLVSLCRDRELVTSEVFAPNDYYGNATILKMYADLPQSYSLKVVIPHAISFSMTQTTKPEAEFPLPIVFCYPSYRKKTFEEKTRKFVINSSCPFLYLVDLLAEHSSPNRVGTIFFPSHSTHHVEARYDVNQVAEKLLALDPKYRPITICLYWKDVISGVHESYSRYGFNVVSAGHVYDPLFQFRFYHLCSLYKYSASNELTSSMFFSIAAGCNFLFIDQINTKYLADEDTLKRDRPIIPVALETELKSVFKVERDFVTEEQNKLTRFFLGAEHKMTPSEMRMHFLLAEILDKAGYLRFHNTTLVLSPWLTRVLTRLRRQILDIVKFYYTPTRRK